tara:strand:- start:183 stop:431 length:249 start_codon:yes stop_codon:yes gene_type:complete
MSKQLKVQWQVGYYRLPENERQTVQDHTGELDFYDVESDAQEAAEKLQREGKGYNIGLTEMHAGDPVDSWNLRLINGKPDWV